MAAKNVLEGIKPNIKKLWQNAIVNVKKRYRSQHDWYLTRLEY